MLGIDMTHNFMRPYFSDSISEFWRRWHMSLSFWCRDYIFFTISLSKTFGKLGKSLRKVLGDRIGKLFPVLVAQMATFLTIGLWHGAEFKYIAYGLYNGGIIILGLLLEPYLKKLISLLHINVEGVGWKVFRVLRTFFLIVMGRMFPKALSFGAAIYMFGAMFRGGGGCPVFRRDTDTGTGRRRFSDTSRRLYRMVHHQLEPGKGYRNTGRYRRETACFKMAVVPGSLCRGVDTGRLRTGIRRQRFHIQRILNGSDETWQKGRIQKGIFSYRQ